MNRKFQRRIENFNCENCGQAVEGGGYTNHCPACLWSKHVDVHPGDRAEDCGGMMTPVAVEKKGDGYRIQQECQTCGHMGWNKASAEDDFEMIVQISAGDLGMG